MIPPVFDIHLFHFALLQVRSSMDLFTFFRRPQKVTQPIDADDIEFATLLDQSQQTHVTTSQPHLPTTLNTQLSPQTVISASAMTTNVTMSSSSNPINVSQFDTSYDTTVQEASSSSSSSSSSSQLPQSTSLTQGYLNHYPKTSYTLPFHMMP